MHIQNFKLNNFKNIKKVNFEFENDIYYFFSPNGTGKTNLLEAMQILSLGKSNRTSGIADLFNFQSKENTLRIQGIIIDDEIKIDHEVIIDRLKPRSKILFKNKNKLTPHNYIGNFLSIWFSPENIKIINSSPKNKRKYFDDIISQLFPEYSYNLRSYNRILKQRNNLLQSAEIDKVQIKAWTQNLIDYGSKIIAQREKFFKYINDEFKKLEDFPRYEFYIDFQPNIKISRIFDEDIEYTFRKNLQDSYSKDISLESTFRGPHKDNWELLIKIKPQKEFISCSKFASRGQQRMALIVLQMVLIRLFEELKDNTPILLLDDIFSELDNENEKILIDFIISKKIQTFITGVEKIKNKSIQQINLQDFLS
jgi:DNA replication and repair protein RecF